MIFTFRLAIHARNGEKGFSFSSWEKKKGKKSHLCLSNMEPKALSQRFHVTSSLGFFHHLASLNSLEAGALFLSLKPDAWLQGHNEMKRGLLGALDNQFLVRSWFCCWVDDSKRCSHCLPTGSCLFTEQCVGCYPLCRISHSSLMFWFM